MQKLVIFTFFVFHGAFLFSFLVENILKIGVIFIFWKNKITQISCFSEKCRIFAGMKLHIFNPEHDLALAFGGDNFTAPHAGRQLRADLGYLPAVWAADGDFVLVEDVEVALERVRHLESYTKEVAFVTKDDLKALPLTDIEPWGWDAALCAQLARNGVSAACLLNHQQLNNIRTLSSRKFAAVVLPQFVAHDERLVGKSEYIEDIETLHRRVKEWRHCVLKAPWSSSGRGVRYVQDAMDEPLIRWAEHILERQGGIMIEPYYNKVIDFGMEFESLADGVRYVGLSLFQTINGAYAGSILTQEHVKRELLARYLPLELLDAVRQRIIDVLSPLFKGQYMGPFGIDMMVCAKPYRLHPCVEINLRRTMGHVAMAMTPSLVGLKELMRIDYEHTRYHLRIRPFKSDINNDII